MEAFRAFDFESDERWVSYRRNVEIPSGRNQDQALLKCKAKWYKREVDPAFDVNLVHTSTPTNGAGPPPQPTGTVPKQPGAAPSTCPPRSSETKPKSSSGSSWWSRFTTGAAPGAASRPTRTAAPPAASGSSGALWLNFVLQVVLVGCVPVAALPLSPRLSTWAFRVALQCSAVLHGQKVFTAHGWPRWSPFPQAALEWVSHVAGTVDFQYMLQALLFMPQSPQVMALLPSAILAAYHAIVFLRARAGQYRLWQQYGAPLFALMAKYQSVVSSYRAVADIMLGFSLLLGLLTPRRSVLLTATFWQLLKLRYWAPDFSADHRQAWALVGSRVQPLLLRVPILRTPVTWVQRWFLSNPTVRA